MDQAFVRAAQLEQARPRLRFVLDRHPCATVAPGSVAPSCLAPPFSGQSALGILPGGALPLRGSRRDPARARRLAAARCRRTVSPLTACAPSQACSRADVEVVLYSGRRQGSVFENSRIIGSSSYIFELGCGLVVDGELEWLTDGIVPSASDGTIFEQIERVGGAGAAARALRGPARVPHALVDRPRGLPPVPRRRRPRRGARGCSTDAGLRLAAARRQRRRPRAPRADGRGCRSSTPIT